MFAWILFESADHSLHPLDVATIALVAAAGPLWAILRHARRDRAAGLGFPVLLVTPPPPGS
jgi:hypothetical protein